MTCPPESAVSHSISPFAYFNFLDHRSLFSSLGTAVSSSPCAYLEEDDDDLKGIERLQFLLDLLMQIRPYADGMEVGLVLEAMDCVVIEIFEVYSGICNGIARILIGVRGSDSSYADERVKRRRETGIRTPRRAAADIAQLSSYFDLCRTLGVLNAADLHRIEGIPEKDMYNIEVLMMGGAPTANAPAAEEEAEDEGKRAIVEAYSATMMGRKCALFEDVEHFVNTSLLRSPEKTGKSAVANPHPVREFDRPQLT